MPYTENSTPTVDLRSQKVMLDAKLQSNSHKMGIWKVAFLISFLFSVIGAQPAPAISRADHNNIHFTDEISAETHDTLVAKCQESGTDVIVLLDVSGANENVFLQHKHMLFDIVDVSYVEGKNQFGLVTFSDTSHLRIPLGSNKRKEEIYSRIRDVPIISGTSSTSKAFILALTELGVKRPRNASVTMILLQDGLSKDRWPISVQTSEELKKAKVTVFALTLNPNYYYAELILYAKNAKNVYTPRRFQDFIPEFEKLIQNNKNCGMPSKEFSIDSMIDDRRPQQLSVSCDTQEVDLIFVLDTSGALEEGFQGQKDIISRLLRDVESESFIRVSLIHFSDTATVSFGLPNSLNSSEQIALLDSVEQYNGTGRRANAMFAAAQELENFSREKSLKVVILFTSSSSADSVIVVSDAANSMRSLLNAEVFCLVSSLDVPVSELLEYTDLREDRVYRDSQREQFLIDLYSVLNLTVCDQPSDGEQLEQFTPAVLYQKDPCSAEKIDLIFLIDTSVSVTSIFKQHIKIVEEILRLLPLEDMDINVGLLSFNDSVEAVVTLDEQASKGRLLNAVSKLTFSKGNTRSVWGIRLALKQFRIGGREDAMPVIVHLSDGKSQDSWADVKKAGKKLREYGIQLFAVSYSADPDIEELKEYASPDTSRLYLRDQVGRLMEDLETLTMKLDCGANQVKEAEDEVQHVLQVQHRDDHLESTLTNQLPTAEFHPCQPTKSDVLLLVDTTARTESDFVAGKKQLITLVDYLLDKTGNTDLVRFGILSFNETVVVAVDFDSGGTPREIKRVTHEIQFTSLADSNPVNAINVAVMKLEEFRRTGTQQLMIIFSDGNSRNIWEDTVNAGAQLQLRNQVFSVTYSTNANLPELEVFAGSETRVYLPHRKAEFFSDVKNLIESEDCGAPSLTPTRNPNVTPAINVEEKRNTTNIQRTTVPNTVTSSPAETSYTENALRDTPTEKKATVSSFKTRLLQKQQSFAIPAQNGCEESVPVDLLLAIDTSGPDEKVTLQRKRAAHKIVSWILSDPNPEKYRIALIEFSETSRLILSLDNENLLAEILPAIELIEHSGERTATGEAAELIVREVTAKGRNSALPVVILLTDGNSVEPWTTLIIRSDQLRRTGTQTFAILHSEDTAYLPELVLYTGSPYRVYMQLRLQQFLFDLEKLIFVEYCFQPKPVHGSRAKNKITPNDNLSDLFETYSTRSVDKILEEDVSPLTESPWINCPKPEIDLVLIIDTSGSSEHVFLRQKELAFRIVQSLPEDAEFTRVALAIIRFSGDAVLEVPFSSYQSRAVLIHKLTTLEFVGGSTALSRAVLLATKELERGQRIQAKSVVVLLSDGKSEDPWEITKQRSAELHRTGATVFAVSFSQSVGLSDLEAYTGSLDKVFLQQRAPDVIDELNNLLSAAEANCRGKMPMSTTPSIPLKSMTTPTRIASCNPAKTDVIFLLDTTSEYQEFLAYRSLILNAVQDLLTFDSPGTRIAISVIHFAETTVVQIPLSIKNSEELILKKISEIEHRTGIPNPEAIQLALESFEQFGREDARSILVMMSSTEWISSRGATGQHDGIETFVVNLAEKPLIVPPEMRLYTRETLPLFTVDLRLITNTIPCIQHFSSSKRFRSRSPPSLSKGKLTAIPKPAILLPAAAATLDKASLTEPNPTADESALESPSSGKSALTEGFNGVGPGCRRSVVDIVILMDTSDSVKSEEFLLQKRLARELLDLLYDITPEGLSVSLVSFGSRAYYALRLSPVRRRNMVFHALEDISHSGGRTATSEAVHLAIQELNRASRPEATQIVLLFNSGNSMDIWYQVMGRSEQLHETGADVFAVSFSRDVYIRELKQYSGSLHRVYIGKRISQLIGDLIESIQFSCDVQDHPIRYMKQPQFQAVHHRVTQIVKRSTEGICLTEKVDLVIVFDRSTSVEEVFTHQKELTLSLIDKLPISADGKIAVSLVSYSDTARLILPLIPGRSRSEVRTAVENLIHTGGSTATASAVQLSIADYRRGRRSDAIPVFVLLNDGNSQDPWSLVLQTSDTLDSLGLHRFGAALSDQVYIPELMHYVGRDRIYRKTQTRQFVEEIERTVGSFGKYCPDVTARTPTTSTAAPTTTTTPQCRPNLVDIAIVVDRAPSDSETFEVQKSVILDLLGTLPLPPHSNVARVTVIAYSKKAKTHVRFSPNQNRNRILKKVANIMYSSGVSKTADAMKQAQQEFVNNGRTLAKKVLISFTDGHSGDAWARASQTAFELEHSGIEVHCAALAPHNFDGELLLYAKSEQRIYKQDSIGRLSAKIQNITKETPCKDETYSLKITIEEPSNQLIAVSGFEKVKASSTNCSTDLVMILDASGSVEDTFDQLKLLASEISMNLQLYAPDGVRLAVIKYAGPGKSQVTVSLEDGLETEDIVSIIANMTHTSGITETSEALDLAFEEFKRGTSSGIQIHHRICILLTDGFSTTDPTDSARRLRDEEVEIFAAFSSSENATNQKELAMITGDPSKVFTDETVDYFFAQINPRCLL